MAVRWKCPICQKATEPLTPQFPFCSERCRTQDLANWSTESYRISTPLRPTDEDFEHLRADPDEIDLSRDPETGGR